MQRLLLSNLYIFVCFLTLQILPSHLGAYRIPLSDINPKTAQGRSYIRAFDLGGGGLKTALLYYDEERKEMDWIESPSQLGQCPGNEEVSDWIRNRVGEVLGKELDKEIEAGYLFAFSLAGLNKLRTHPLETSDLSILFDLPAESINALCDGQAHLCASLHSLGRNSVPAPIWNFAIGTAVALGFTDSLHQKRKGSDLWHFFEMSPWSIKEPRTGLDFHLACGSAYGFDSIVREMGGKVDEAAFIEFALRWKSFIESAILSRALIPSKGWGAPSAIVFTGGHIDLHGDRLKNALQAVGLNLPVYTGPKYGGLLGAACDALLCVHGHSPLVNAVLTGDRDKFALILEEGSGVNERDALGKTALCAAAELGSIWFIEKLLEKGAEINACDFAGFTPLHLAAKGKHSEAVKMLLDRGAVRDVRDYWGRRIRNSLEPFLNSQS